jgi:hypothetical protein
VARKRTSRKTTPRRAQPAKPKAGVELEKFTDADLRIWQRQAEVLERYHVQLYFHLEGQRALRHRDLCDALRESVSASIAVNRWSRIVDYKYSLQPLSAAGSLVRGGRFNIGNDLDPGRYPAFPALYLAQDYDTAYAERYGQRRSVAGKLEGHEYALRRPGSFTSVNVHGHLYNLFDLRNARNLRPFVEVVSEFDLTKELRELAVSAQIKGPLLVKSPAQLKSNLLAHNWRLYPSQYEIPANPQVFGRLVADSGFDGIVYASTKGPGACVALFPANFPGTESHVELADELPRGATHTRLDQETWREIAGPDFSS